jgi:hypothetical protein
MAVLHPEITAAIAAVGVGLIAATALGRRAVTAGDMRTNGSAADLAAGDGRPDDARTGAELTEVASLSPEQLSIP